MKKLRFSFVALVFFTSMLPSAPFIGTRPAHAYDQPWDGGHKKTKPDVPDPDNPDDPPEPDKCPAPESAKKSPV